MSSRNFDLDNTVPSSKRFLMVVISSSIIDISFSLRIFSLSLDDLAQATLSSIKKIFDFSKHP